MRTHRPLVATALAAALLAASGGTAAAVQPQDTFGAHVSCVAQARGGFSGDHNPGKHQGMSGWGTWKGDGTGGGSHGCPTRPHGGH
ncbi:hypothetical protein [Ornithinimicrobium sediminis]|uniref:hypothetical protein n=1 Tax=Ornithinimicrobium sediminis TaxID=2904603 RepID=UPI001E4417FE|nr:hypothetical protein [Ornithinimicrobium sediminis]MCE0486181.1 hypothetical protein [Ornithinimicrobium sediminis]